MFSNSIPEGSWKPCRPNPLKSIGILFIPLNLNHNLSQNILIKLYFYNLRENKKIVFRLLNLEYSNEIVHKF